jgi:hypothetical protein
MMSLAVRVEKALPLDDKKAPVPALEIAARVAGTSWPSRPQMLGCATPSAQFGDEKVVMSVVSRALVI